VSWRQQMSDDVGMLGPVVSGAGSLFRGLAGYRAGSANATGCNQEAQQAIEAGQEKSARVRRLVAYQQSTLKATVGGQGTTMAGSPMEVLLENAKQGELLAQDETYKALLQARVKKIAAAQATATGRNDLTAGILGAATGIVTESPLLRKLKNP